MRKEHPPNVLRKRLRLSPNFDNCIRTNARGRVIQRVVSKPKLGSRFWRYNPRGLLRLRSYKNGSNYILRLPENFNISD